MGKLGKLILISAVILCVAIIGFLVYNYTTYGTYLGNMKISSKQIEKPLDKPLKAPQLKRVYWIPQRGSLQYVSQINILSSGLYYCKFPLPPDNICDLESHKECLQETGIGWRGEIWIPEAALPIPSMKVKVKRIVLIPTGDHSHWFAVHLYNGLNEVYTLHTLGQLCRQRRPNEQYEINLPRAVESTAFTIEAHDHRKEGKVDVYIETEE